MNQDEKDNLDFRKFLTTYGISFEEYQKMGVEQQSELLGRFNAEMQKVRQIQTSEGIASCGQALEGCGCSLMMLPIVIVLLFIAFSVLFSLF